MALCVAFDVKRQTLFKVPEVTEVEPARQNPVKAYLFIFICGLVVLWLVVEPVQQF